MLYCRINTECSWLGVVGWCVAHLNVLPYSRSHTIPYRLTHHSWYAIINWWDWSPLSPSYSHWTVVPHLNCQDRSENSSWNSMVLNIAYIRAVSTRIEHHSIIRSGSEWLRILASMVNVGWQHSDSPMTEWFRHCENWGPPNINAHAQMKFTPYV